MDIMFELHALTGPLAGQILQLAEAGIYYCGRHPDCQICLTNDDQVSRRHCRFEVTAAGVRLVDLGSANGCVVNALLLGGADNPDVRNMDLKQGDVIEVGSTTFAVEIRPADAPA